MKTHFSLEPNKYLSKCEARNVISFNSRDPIFISKLYSLVKATFDYNFENFVSNMITRKLGSKCDAKQWLKDGEKCEILKANSLGWQTGIFKLRINLSLEFIPDELRENVSPLDDVRQEINTNNI